MTTTRYLSALADELRARGTQPAGTEPAEVPPDVALLGQLVAAHGRLTLGQWELGVGAAAHARQLVDGLEPIDDEPLPTAAHVTIVANNAGGLVAVAGWDDLTRTCGAWVIDEAHFELVRDYRDLDDWLGAVVFDPDEEARDHAGLVAAIRARVTAAAGGA